MRFKSFLALAAVLAIPMPGTAGESSGDGAEDKVKVHGFVQTWMALTEEGDKTADDFNMYLNHVRISVKAKMMDGVKIVITPEFAGGVELLDAYADLKLLGKGMPFIRVGQFKHPFGLDRMKSPYELNRVNYSLVKKLFPGHPWDVGFAVNHETDNIRVSLGLIQGQGANLASGSLVQRKRNDFSGRAEYLLLDGKLVVGASLYQGLSNATGFAEENHTWGGGHLVLKMGGFELNSELVNRDDLKFAASVEPSFKVTDKLKIVAYYDRMEYQKDHAKSKTIGGGAAVFKAGKSVELTLDIFGTGKGPKQELKSTEAVLQTQVKF